MHSAMDQIKWDLSSMSVSVFGMFRPYHFLESNFDCRYALVPQPEHHAPGPGPTGASGPAPRSPGASSGEPGGLFNGFFGPTSNDQSSGASSRPRHNGSSRRRSNTDPRRRHGSSSERDLPGGWGES